MGELVEQEPGPRSMRARDLEIEALIGANEAERSASRLAGLDVAMRVLVVLLGVFYAAASLYSVAGGERATVWLIGIGPWLAVMVLAANLFGIDAASQRLRARSLALRQAADRARALAGADEPGLARWIGSLRAGLR